MNIEQLKQSNRIIFECIAGSHMYALNNPNSDIDIRGLYVNPSVEYLGLQEPAGQISDDKHDTTYYSLKRFFELAMKANPNIIELLFVPEACVKIQTEIMTKLIENRHLFISKKCYHSHSGYAFAQIHKATGSNKKVHNPQPKEQPKKEDFCWVITDFKGDRKGYDWDKAIFPCRPIPLSETDINLKFYHVSSMEHSHNIFRLYYYGGISRGVFRGNDMLVCESIPKEDEIDHFCGLLIYNQNQYEKAIKDHKSYHDWVKNRNESRWVDQEKGKLNYDQKNLTHCMRLLISGENILANSEPIVRFEGKQLEYLMKIRAGELSYEEIMQEVENKMKKLEELYENSSIPHSVNIKKINELYMELQEDTHGVSLLRDRLQ